MYLLLKDSISYEELVKASRMLKHFCVRIHHYMEKGIIRIMYIIYSILHILFVSWIHYGRSQHFGTTITMVIIKNLFHGMQNVTLQIVTNVVALQKIPEISRALVPGTVAYKLYNQMTKKCHQSLKNLLGESILCGVNTVGLLQKDTLTTEEKLIITTRLSAINVSYV